MRRMRSGKRGKDVSKQNGFDTFLLRVLLSVSG